MEEIYELSSTRDYKKTVVNTGMCKSSRKGICYAPETQSRGLDRRSNIHLQYSLQWERRDLSDVGYLDGPKPGYV